MKIVVHEMCLFLNIDNCIENSNYVDKSILLMLAYDDRINRFGRCIDQQHLSSHFQDWDRQQVLIGIHLRQALFQVGCTNRWLTVFFYTQTSM